MLSHVDHVAASHQVWTCNLTLGLNGQLGREKEVKFPNHFLVFFSLVIQLYRLCLGSGPSSSSFVSLPLPWLASFSFQPISCLAGRCCVGKENGINPVFCCKPPVPFHPWKGRLESLAWHKRPLMTWPTSPLHLFPLPVDLVLWLLYLSLLLPCLAPVLSSCCTILCLIFLVRFYCPLRFR